MPEGPEVKNLVNWLNKKFKNKKILNIIIQSGKYKKNPFKLDKIKFPLNIDTIDCKGKLIYFLFKNSDTVLMVTLGMTGWFILNEEKHNHVIFKIEKTKLFFNDYRNFGNIIISNKINLNKKLNTLGPDILNLKKNQNEYYKMFIERINRKRDDTYIASALLDQKVACGVGNYIRSEALYISKLSPFKKIKNINKNELIKLWDNLREIGFYYYNENIGKSIGINFKKYKKLINLSGSKSKDGPSKYKPTEGLFLVYRQNNDPFGNKVTSEKINNRTVHFVKNIQI